MKLTRTTKVSPQINVTQVPSTMAQQSNIDNMHREAHGHHKAKRSVNHAAGQVPFVRQPRGPDTQSY